MAQQYDFYVILGCFGLTTDGFVCCTAIQNIILKINPSLVKYNEMMDYFDSCRLFDKPLLELNSIRHFVFNLQDRFDQVQKPLWKPKKFELIQKFLIDHRNCGLFIKLEIPDFTIIEEIIKPADERIAIKSTKSSAQNFLKLIKRT